MFVLQKSLHPWCLYLQKSLTKSGKRKPSEFYNIVIGILKLQGSVRVLMDLFILVNFLYRRRQSRHVDSRTFYTKSISKNGCVSLGLFGSGNTEINIIWPSPWETHSLTGKAAESSQVNAMWLLSGETYFSGQWRVQNILECPSLQDYIIEWNVPLDSSCCDSPQTLHGGVLDGSSHSHFCMPTPRGWFCYGSVLQLGKVGRD